MSRLVIVVGLFLVISSPVLVGCASSVATTADELAAKGGPMGLKTKPARPDNSSQGEREKALPQLGADSGLSDYLAYAALNNAGLQAAFRQWKAALQRMPQVKALPDPRFTYRWFIQEVETRVGAQRQAFQLSQLFPWFGKLELRGDVAAERAKAAYQEYEARKLKLFFEVTDAYSEYYYLGQAIRIVERNRDLIEYLEGVARSRYKVGAAEHADVIRAQVELGKLDDRLRTLEDLKAPIVARLNAALNRPVDSPIPLPTSIPQEQIQFSDEQLLEMFRTRNPELKALSHDVAGRERAIELAKKDYFPDFTLGVDYVQVADPLRAGAPGFRSPAAQRSLSRFLTGAGDLIDANAIGRSFLRPPKPNDAGKDAWIVFLSINLPVWYEKYRAGELEAVEQYWSAVKTLRDRENTLASQIRMAAYRYHDAERKIDLYGNTLVPKAEESLKASESAYRAGASTFTDLVDAERVLLDFQLGYERALADRQQRLAELDMLIGARLERKAEQ